ncbi:MAG: class I SAM-dependent methyltransferase [Acidimicrobiia bacterium]
MSRIYEWLYRVVRVFHVPIPWVFGTHPELAQLVESGRVRQGGRAIDLGCGAGREAIYLADKGFDVIGVDISPTAIRMAEKAAAGQDSAARFVVDDLTELSHVDGKFDLLVDYGALNDLNSAQRDAYMRSVLPLANEGSQFVLMCFDNKLPREEIEDRFGKFYEIERFATKGETGTRRRFSFYLMEQE